jgi:type IV fimbrial biogenesis protein FimT
VELLVTVSVASIVLSLAVPSFNNLVNDMQRSAVITELSVAIMSARSESLKRGEQVSVCPSSAPGAATPSCSSGTQPEWNTGWLVFIDDNGNQAFDASDDVVLRVHDMDYAGFSLKGAGALQKGITFQSNGYPAKTGSIAYKAEGESEYKRLRLASIGRIVIENCSGGDSVSCG